MYKRQVFALFVGILIAKLGERVDTVANFFSQFNDVMMEMTSTVMLAAPIGVFCLIAKTFSGIGFSAFLPVSYTHLDVYKRQCHNIGGVFACI